MNLIITGAFGFVGTNLSKILKASLNHRLIAIDVTESDHHIFDEYYSWNDLEKVECSRVYLVVHLAEIVCHIKNSSVAQK